MTNRAMQEKRGGFTLLELMTVMVIMFLLMGLATTAFRGAMRGSGISGAQMNVRAALRMARQYAMTHHCRTYVVFGVTGAGAHYSYALAQVATAASGSGTHVVTTRTLPWGSGDLEKQEIHNAGIPASMTVLTNTLMSITGENPGLEPSGVWQAGDPVCIQIRARDFLPQGIEFETIEGSSDPDNWPSMQFNNDGTATYSDGATDPFEIDLSDGNTASAQSVTVTVSDRTGRIE